MPGVRVDRYELKPEVDSIFAEDNPTTAVAQLKKTSVSPKLGMVWRFTDEWSLFAGYARGFRSPPYNDVNIGLTNVAFRYTAIANPDLKPEPATATNWACASLRRRRTSASAATTTTTRIHPVQRRYRSQRTGLTVFQSQNIADARIYGAEMKAGIEFGELSPALKGWALRSALAWSRGDNRTDDEPLASVDPLRGTLGLMYDTDTWGVELAGTFVQRKKRLPPPAAQTNPNAPAPFVYQPAGYGVLDLMAHWNFAPGATFNVGVFNLADKRYIEWSSITPSLITDRALSDRFSSPGRTFSASLAVPGDLMSRALSARRNDSIAAPNSAAWPTPAQLATLGTVLCLYHADGNELGGWRQAVRVHACQGVDSEGLREACASLMDAAAACGACTCCPTAIPGLGPSGRGAAAGTGTRQRGERWRTPVAAPGRPSWRPALAPVRAALACRRRRTHAGRQSVDPVLAGRGHRAPHRTPWKVLKASWAIDDCCCADAARRPAPQIPGDLPLIRL